MEFLKENFRYDHRIKIISLRENYGFAKGNNFGVANSRGSYIVFLNIDTEVDCRWLKEAIKAMRNEKKIGAAQCKLLLKTERGPRILDSGGISIVGTLGAILGSFIITLSGLFWVDMPFVTYFLVLLL